MKLKIAGALLALAASSYGAVVTITSVGSNYDGTDDYSVVLSNGTPVAPSSGIVRVGYFTTLTDLQVTTLAAAQDYATLFGVGSFQTIISDDFTGIADAYGPTPGFVAAGTADFNATGLNNTLYVYITSGTELGLFQTNFTIVPDSPQPALPGEYNVFFYDGDAVIGSFGNVTIDYSSISGSPGNVEVNSFQLVDAIPEPSVALLGALGALGLLRRRRN